MTRSYRLPLLLGELLSGQTADADRYAAAGCDMLLIPPTGTADPLPLIRQLSAAGGLPAAGVLRPLPEAAGTETMTTRLHAYQRQAVALREAGVALLYGQEFTHMNDARAALLAARETGLPVFMDLAVGEDGATTGGLTLLPALITLQALGAAAVGVMVQATPEAVGAMTEWIAGALPYAAVPLIAGLRCPQAACSPAAYGTIVEEWLDAGAAVIAGGVAAPEHLAVARGALDRHPTVAAQEIDTDAVAGEGYACFLGDDLEAGEPLTCTSRLADALIEAEDERNVALVHITQAEDIPLFVEAAKVCRLPLAVKADSAALLDETLLAFPGRLLVDSLGEIEPDLLKEIAGHYGAIVY